MKLLPSPLSSQKGPETKSSKFPHSMRGERMCKFVRGERKRDTHLGGCEPVGPEDQPQNGAPASPSCQWGGLPALFPEADFQGWVWGRPRPESGLTSGGRDTGRCWEAGSTVSLAELEVPAPCVFLSRVWLWLAEWGVAPEKWTKTRMRMWEVFL